MKKLLVGLTVVILLLAFTTVYAKSTNTNLNNVTNSNTNATTVKNDSSKDTNIEDKASVIDKETEGELNRIKSNSQEEIEEYIRKIWK